MGEGEAVDKKKDRKILVKIICVIASFTLWLYIANDQNPEKDRTIFVKADIINVDSLANLNLTLTKNQDFTVKVKLKGPMLEVNSVDPSQVKVEGDLLGYALPKGKFNLPVRVKSELPNDVTIVDPESLRVTVSLDELIQKSVPVKVDFNVIPKTGYTDFSPKVSPSSVYISGASDYVNDVSYVAAKVDAKNVESDVQVSLPLKAYDDANRVVDEVSINPKNVDVVVPIMKTKSVGINVETKGNIDTDMILKKIEPMVDKVEITGDANVLKLLNSVDTEEIDLSQIKESQTIEVKLNLPDEITTVLDMDTISVKITVEKIIQKNFSVDIKYNNLPEGSEFKSDKDKVSIVLSGPEDIMNNVKADDIQCTVDLSNLTDNQEGYDLKINIVVPEGVSIHSSSADNVRVTIAKKQVEPAAASE